MESNDAADPEDTDIDRRSLGDFLEQLAARLPTPGAGAASAVEAALAASLLAMVGRFTTDDQHADAVREIVAVADALRDECLAAAAADETAFAAVAQALKSPAGTDDEQRLRDRRLRQAQRAAAEPPRTVIDAAAALVSLAERVLPIANPNLVSDVAAATAVARSAATTARLAVQTNLSALGDDDRAELAQAETIVDGTLRRADAVEAAVREQLGRGE